MNKVFCSLGCVVIFMNSCNSIEKYKNTRKQNLNNNEIEGAQSPGNGDKFANNCGAKSSQSIADDIKSEYKLQPLYSENLDIIAKKFSSAQMNALKSFINKNHPLDSKDSNVSWSKLGRLGCDNELLTWVSRFTANQLEYVLPAIDKIKMKPFSWVDRAEKDEYTKLIEGYSKIDNEVVTAILKRSPDGLPKNKKIVELMIKLQDEKGRDILKLLCSKTSFADGVKEQNIIEKLYSWEKIDKEKFKVLAESIENIFESNMMMSLSQEKLDALSAMKLENLKALAGDKLLPQRLNVEIISSLDKIESEKISVIGDALRDFVRYHQLSISLSLDKERIEYLGKMSKESIRKYLSYDNDFLLGKDSLSQLAKLSDDDIEKLLQISNFKFPYSNKSRFSILTAKQISSFSGLTEEEKETFVYNMNCRDNEFF